MNMKYVNLFGTRVYLSELVTELAEAEVEKTFKERWFPNPITEPFEPWVKTKTIMVEVPASKALVMPHGLVMHPMMYDQLKAAIDEGRVVYEETEVNWF